MADNLFPFVEPYGVFAGKCDGANPGTDDLLSRQVIRGQDAAALVVRQPALNVRVDVRTSNSQSRSYTGDVLVKATMATDAAGCGETITLTSTDSTTTSQRGWVSRYDTPSLYDPGIPFGTWTLCAQYRPNTSSAWRKHTLTINNNSPAGDTTLRYLEPYNSSSGMSSAGTC